MLLASKTPVVTGGNSGIGADLMVDYITHREETDAIIDNISRARSSARNFSSSFHEDWPLPGNFAYCVLLDGGIMQGSVDLEHVTFAAMGV